MPSHIVDKRSESGSEGHEEQVFEEFLRRRGLKFTQPRRLLLRKIFAMHDHFTAEQLMDRLRKDRVHASKATVYRTLAVMLECDLLTSHDFGEGALYYEHTLGHSHHDHLFCLHCKRIVEFRDDRIEDLQEKVAREVGFHLLSHSLKMFGLCRECSSKASLVERYATMAASLHRG